MKLGFDAKRLYCNFTGLGNYSRTLVKNLQLYFPDEQYFLYTPCIKHSKATDAFLKDPALRTMETTTRFRSFWRSVGMVDQLKKDRIELYHGLSNEIPLGLKKSGIKSVLTIHDLIFKSLPQTYKFIDRNMYDIKFRHSCQSADLIIAISENTKRDIIKFYGIAENKIRVVYQSCDPVYFRNIDVQDANFFLNNQTVPKEYLLYVGSVEKRKNLKLIIKALSQLPPDLQIPLVIVGKGRSYAREVKSMIAEKALSDRIYWFDNLTDNVQLKALYQNASALIYPSHYEGFGLPVAEALLCKTPVITSNTSSLPEAGGPGALYINPNDSEQLADSISRILTDDDLRQKLVTRGHAYALDNFQAKKMAIELMDSYKQLLLQ